MDFSWMRILLVEDSQINRMVATSMLSKMVGAIDIASNGAEAVEAVLNNHYDLILMDIAMPEMDGVEATRVIRCLPPPKGRTPIIAMTAHATAADREHCFAAGMDDYLIKPVDRNRMTQALMRWSRPPVPTFAGMIGGGPDIDCDEAPPPVAAGAGGNGSTQAPDSDRGQAAPAPEARYAVLDPAALEQLEANTDPLVIQELVKTFIIETIDRLERISRAVKARDLEILEREAHALKGSSGTFGARALEERAKAIELACKKGDAETAVGLSGNIRQLAASATNAMVRHFQSGG